MTCVADNRRIDALTGNALNEFGDISVPARPAEKRPVRELLELAGIDVSDWAFTKDGEARENPNDNIGRNTRWAYVGDRTEPIVLCLWYDHIDWAATPPVYRGNEEIYQRRLIALAGTRSGSDGLGRLNSKISRARQLQRAVYEAFARKRRIHLILVDGEEVALEDSADKASIVTARSLDLESWYVHEFDAESGDFKMVRGEKPPRDCSLSDEQIIDPANDPVFLRFIESLDDTERDALIKTRLGQGPFRDSLINRWGGCSLTGCKHLELLVASHIKPWSRCESARERVDVANGLLLIPNIDKLFDRGLVTFDGDFKIILSDDLKDGVARTLNIDKHARLVNREFADMRPYLNWHREHVFRK